MIIKLEMTAEERAEIFLDDYELQYKIAYTLDEVIFLPGYDVVVSVVDVQPVGLSEQDSISGGKDV